MSFGGKRWPLLVSGFVAFVGLTVWLVLFRPGKLEGAWQIKSLGCMCDCYGFLYCKNGYLVAFREAHDAPQLWGRYTELDDGTFEWQYPGGSYRLDVRGMRLFVDGKFEGWRGLRMDKTRAVMAQADQQQVARMYSITVLPGGEAYSFQTSVENVPFETVSKLLCAPRLGYQTNGVRVYHSDHVPNEMLHLLEEQHIPYSVHPVDELRWEFLFDEEQARTL